MVVDDIDMFGSSCRNGISNQTDSSVIITAYWNTTWSESKLCGKLVDVLKFFSNFTGSDVLALGCGATDGGLSG